LAAHLAGELFKAEAKIDIVHVPYKSNGSLFVTVCDCVYLRKTLAKPGLHTIV
jgi:hypothetical protein